MFVQKQLSSTSSIRSQAAPNTAPVKASNMDRESDINKCQAEASNTAPVKASNMDRESDINKCQVEASKSENTETKNEKDDTETNTISPDEKKSDFSDTPIQLNDEECDRKDLEFFSNSKKRKHSPSPGEGSEKVKVLRLMETNTSPLHSSTTVDSSVEAKASLVQLTATGESYYNKMLVALGAEKLDVSTFCTILPYICNDYGAPNGESLVEEEVILLCYDLIQNAKTVLTKKRDDARVEGDEENEVSEKLGAIIAELEMYRDFSLMSI